MALNKGAAPGKRRRPQLIELLLADGSITQAQADQALEEQARTRKSVPRILMELGLMTEGQVVAILAQQLGLPFIELADYPIDASAASLLPEKVARRYRAVAIAFEGETLVVAISDPTNVIALDDIRTITGRDIKQVVASRTDIEEALNRLQALDDSAGTLLEGMSEEEEEAAELEKVEEAPIVKFIHQVIAQAVQARASDIHIEPQERHVRIRYRIDGVLHEKHKPQKSFQAGMTSRLKVMADLNIAERRLPQDGRVSLTIDRKPIDLRVSTMPTVWGEKVVIRILDSSTAVLDLEELGFQDYTLKKYAESYTKPYGAILVTGPTGSGKSTTLYATLHILNKADRNLVTVEDPVEYRMAGISQIQVNPKAGLTFASALRSILRQDPDIVMVGEIRDRETAVTGIEAALTGHLVLSSLHTNDAPSAVTRLIEMQIEPFLVASGVDCVLAQRLARKLCPRCKEAYTPTSEALIENNFPWRPGEDVPQLYRPVGCQYCAKTGFRGRIAIAEVMLVTEQIERLVVERRSSDEIRRLAVQQGMVPLREDGMEKARLGLTSVEEVLRVVI